MVISQHIAPGGEADETVWSAVAGDIAIPAQFEAHIKLNNDSQTDDKQT